MRQIDYPIMGPFSSPIQAPFAAPAPLPGDHRLVFGYDKLGRTVGNSVHSNTRTAIATVIDFEGVSKTCKAGETRVEGARRVENLATALTTHSITVAVDRLYQVSCTGDNGSTVVLSGAASGTLTNDGLVQQGFDTAKTATTTTLTLTITGTLTGLLVEDVTGQAVTAPSDIIAFGSDHGWGANGVVYYDYQNGNTISGGAVTNAKGAAISSGTTVLAEPAATNAVVNNNFVLRTGDNFDDYAEIASGSSTTTADTSDVPHGFEVCCKITVDGSDANVYVVPTTSRLNVGVGGVAVISMYLKATAAAGIKLSVRADDGAGGSLQYLSTDGSAWQDATAQWVPASQPTAWARADYTLPPTNALRTHVFISSIGRNGGQGAVSHRFTGLQLEKNILTSLIPTTTAALVRGSDAIKFDDQAAWFPATEGFALMRVRPQLDWATNVANTYWLQAGSPGLLAYRNASNNGVRGYDGANVPSIFAGHTPDTDILSASIWSLSLNKFQVGYYKFQEDSWHWDTTPTAYTEIVPDSELKVLNTLGDVEKIAGVKIYSGLPAATLADTQTWLENNAANLIG